MDLAKIAPELREPVRRMKAPPITWTPTRLLIRALTRFAPSGDVSGVAISEETPRVRLYRPEQRRSPAALFWIHGGGMVIGRASLDDRLCASVARELGVVVVSAEYRLAPEHPYPTPLDDCHTGWRWLQEHADALGVDAGRVALGGQSAGGGLAAGLALRLRESGGTTPVAQWLFCPMLDDRTTHHRELDVIGHRVWNNAANRFGWASYLGGAYGEARVPDEAAPARAVDLSGLPPTWIGVGDIDLFRSEDEAYAEGLRAAGVEVSVDLVPGAPHGFEAWAPDTTIAQDYLRRARTWLAAVLGDSADHHA